MVDEVYDQLAEALNRLPNGLARTASNFEIRALKKIFSPEEATIAGQLSGSLELNESISKRIGLLVQEDEAKLTKKEKRGLLWYEDAEGRHP